MSNFLRSAAIAIAAILALSAVPADAQGANTVLRNFQQKGSPCPPNSTPIRPSVGECVCNAGFRAGDDDRCHRVAFAQASASATADAQAEAPGEDLGDDELPPGDRPVVWCDRTEASPGDRLHCQLRGVLDVRAWGPGWSGSYMSGGGADAGRPVGPALQPDFMFMVGDPGAYSIQLRLEHADHPGRYYRPRSWNIEVRGRSTNWVRWVGVAAASAIGATLICRNVCR